ncbi:uncharacterized protein KGF55_002978 [Candida pseudojiufengensis]|uniref:uncharacterized protein n=1 Tax=Candida pseudojiufengensis TaxID=497109 RepID=UPI0022243570|nr:uncharacterized protein KGF55_002978 [Candida pseudojiufengensis]KAI5963186.1 hypothetical protein KGF55_002978 [Candida pseudojiufengensis]
MSNLDDEINDAWNELYDTYVEENKLKKDKEVLKLRKDQELQKQQIDKDKIDISSDVPQLNKLIEAQTSDHQKQLTEELKTILIKYFWAGFQLNKDLKNSNDTDK